MALTTKSVSVGLGLLLSAAAVLGLVFKLDSRWQKVQEAEAFQQATQKAFESTQRALSGLANQIERNSDKDRRNYLEIRIRALDEAYNYQCETMPPAVRSTYESLKQEYSDLTKKLDNK